MKCMNEKGLEAYQVRKKLEKPCKILENQDRSEIGVFLGEKQRSIERDVGIEGFVEEGSRKYSSTAEVSRRYRGSTHQN